jgi:hypothetical protein
MKPASIVLNLIIMSLLLSSPASATCDYPYSCYCSLAPEEGDVLFRAEVVSMDDTTVSIRVQGIPFYDPEGLMSSGQVLAGLTYADPHYVLGNFGIFLVQMKDGHIPYAIAEDGGRYPCYLDPWFRGLTMEQLAEAVLSEDCPMAVYEMGLEPKCPPGLIESGCCYEIRADLDDTAPLVLGLVVLLPRKRFRRRQRKGGHGSRSVEF